MISLIGSYIIWHYTRAVYELTKNCKNGIWFLYHFFSIPILIRTLWYPWQRLGEGYKKGFNIGDMLGTFLLNTIMRLIGFIIRSVCIIIGLCVLSFSVVVSFGLLIIWLLLPAIIVYALVGGSKLILLHHANA